MEDKDDLFKLILGLPKDDTTSEPYFDFHRKSTLQMGLQVARFLYAWMSDNLPNGQIFNPINKLKIASCFKQEGIQIPTEDGFYMTSLLLYLNCLEQIGSLFKDDEHGIHRAINEFHNNSTNRKLDVVTEDELTAIRNLRNSLAHNLGLANIKPNTNVATHKYTLDYSNKNSSRIVDLPPIPFNGDYTDKREETSVKIYVPALIEMVEGVIAEVQNRFKSGTLKADESRFAEIQTRFTIRC